MVAPTINLEQMAEALRVSLPTMRKLLKRYPECPVVARGSNGVPWQFDKAAVIAFFVATRAEEAAASAADKELLAQISLPLDEAVAPEDRGVSASDRLKVAQAMLKEDEVARQRGFLVLTTEMRQRLTGAWIEVAQFLNALPTGIGRQHNLPDAVVRDIRRRVEAQQRQTVQRLRDLLAPEVQPPPEEDDERDAEAA